MPSSTLNIQYRGALGDGAAFIRCHDKTCPCQQQDKRDPLGPGPAPGRPSQAQQKFKEGTHL